MTRRRKSPSRWPVGANRLGERIPRARLHPTVLAWTERRPAKETWCVALSGGADSVALLLLLWTLWPERRDRLVALHFNHRLRGRAATADENFCRRACAGLGVRLRGGRWREARPGGSEAEARTARLAFFGREMDRLRTRSLWLGHQQDDIAETMLMRIARGSGTGGLAAPRPLHVMADGRVHLRPLLTLKKAELSAALRQSGARWREDASNGGSDYFRNRVRDRVLPAWIRAAGRDAVTGAALARERLEEDDEALAEWLNQVKPVDRWGRLDMRRLAGLPRALTRRALHRWLRSVRPPVDLARAGFEVLLASVERGRPTRFSLGPKGFAVIHAGKLSFKLAAARVD